MPSQNLIRVRADAEREFRWRYVLLTVLCMIGVLLLFTGLKPERFRQGLLTGPGVTADIFAEQADAIRQGHAYLDREVPGQLLKLENPYDPAQRRGVPFSWDYALFDGHYYCYFGVAPAVLLYLPVHALTGCYPTLSAACLFFAELATLLLACALAAFRKVFCPGAPDALTLLALPCLICTAGISYTAVLQDRYYLPLIAAIAFFFGFWAAIAGGLARKGFAQRFLFALGAVCLSLGVLSRPTTILPCLAAVPFLIGFLRRSGRWQGLRGALAFFLPLAAGAGVTMAWNVARFGSPLDFGTDYQLTVSDISLNRIDPNWFVYSIRTYFLEDVGLEKGSLPAFLRGTLNPSGRAIYRDMAPGVLFFPAIWGVFAERFLKKREGSGAFRWYVVLTVLLSVLLAWFDCCKGGINLRYLLDILPALLLCGTAVMLRLTGERKTRVGKIACAALLAAFLLASVWISLGVRVFLPDTAIFDPFFRK